jgi:hypothetical protein
MLILNDSPMMTGDGAERFGSFKDTGYAREGILSGNYYCIISHANNTEITISITINHNCQQIFID